MKDKEITFNAASFYAKLQKRKRLWCNKFFMWTIHFWLSLFWPISKACICFACRPLLRGAVETDKNVWHVEYKYKVLIMKSVYMSVLLYIHLKNDVFSISLLSPLYQGNTISFTNAFTYIVDFLTACKSCDICAS